MINKVTVSQHWDNIFDKYDIVEKVKQNGSFIITANQIKEFKEPRLMVKFDTSTVLPTVFKKNHLAILPNSRGSYVIGDFSLYEPFEERSIDFKHVHIPGIYETINKDTITSEAVALNALGLTGALEDFLGETNLAATISGRMTTDDFSFRISNHDNSKSSNITVKGSQMEIDGSYENANVFALIEAKAVVHEDFLIRQLFYPYYYWRKHISKPIRPIFVVYTNDIYRLMEYEFTDADNYSSIKFVREKNYSLENAVISLKDINTLSKSIKYVHENPDIPFVQADTFENVITLAEHLKNGPMTPDEVTDLFDFTSRQTDYYFNAARYLGFVEKNKDCNEGILISLTEKGKDLFRLSYEQRQMVYVKTILEHQIFNDVFQWTITNLGSVTKEHIAKRLLELHCCGESLAERRASSVIQWVKWILNVPNNHE